MGQAYIQFSPSPVHKHLGHLHIMKEWDPLSPNEGEG